MWILLVIIGYYFIHIILNDKAQKTGHDFYENLKKTYNDNPQVYDIIHNNTPDYSHYDYVINYIIVVSLIPMIINYKEDMAYDTIAVLLIVYILRCITINLTILPKHDKCTPSNNSNNDILNGCYDKIFSGHFAFTFVLSLMYYKYDVISNEVILILWNLLNAFLIIVTRSHYTIDVVISLMVCLFVYNFDPKIPYVNK